MQESIDCIEQANQIDAMMNAARYERYAMTAGPAMFGADWYSSVAMGTLSDYAYFGYSNSRLGYNESDNGSGNENDKNGGEGWRSKYPEKVELTEEEKNAPDYGVFGPVTVYADREKTKWEYFGVGMNAFTAGHNPKQALFEIAARSADLGVGVSKYLQITRGVGAAGSIITMVSGGVNVYNDWSNGRPANGWDIADAVSGGVGLFGTILFASNPVGLGIILVGGSAYAIVRLTYGN